MSPVDWVASSRCLPPRSVATGFRPTGDNYPVRGGNQPIATSNQPFSRSRFRAVTPTKSRKALTPFGASAFLVRLLQLANHFALSRAALPAATRAIGTRNGLQFWCPRGLVSCLGHRCSLCPAGIPRFARTVVLRGKLQLAVHFHSGSLRCAPVGPCQMRAQKQHRYVETSRIASTCVSSSRGNACCFLRAHGGPRTGLLSNRVVASILTSLSSLLFALHDCSAAR